MDPEILFFDEPSAGLDPIIAAGIDELILKLKKAFRITIVVVTHELALAAEFADRVVLLHRGKCLRVGTPAAVFQPELLEQVFQAPLDVETGPAGRPRVNLRARRKGKQE